MREEEEVWRVTCFWFQPFLGQLHLLRPLLKHMHGLPEVSPFWLNIFGWTLSLEVKQVQSQVNGMEPLLPRAQRPCAGTGRQTGCDGPSGEVSAQVGEGLRAKLGWRETCFSKEMGSEVRCGGEAGSPRRSLADTSERAWHI